MHRLQETITEIKRDRIWGDRFMRLEELIEIEKRKSRAEGLEEGRAEALLLVKEWMLETAQGKNCDADFIKI